MSKVNLLGGKRKVDSSLMESKTKSLISNINSINVTELNLSQLTNDLRASLTKPEPMTLFFRRRQVKKLQLDVEKQQWLLAKINGLRSLGQELVNLRADAIVSEQMVTLLVQQKLQEAEIEYNKRVHDLDVVRRDIKQIDHEMKSIDFQTNNLETLRLRELEKLRTDILNNDKISADVQAQAIHNKAQSAKAELMQKFAEKFDVDSLSPALQSFAISNLFGAVGSNFSEFEKEQIYKEYFTAELEQELRKKTFQADSLKSKSVSDKSQSDIDRSSADVTMRDNQQVLDEED